MGTAITRDSQYRTAKQLTLRTSITDPLNFEIGFLEWAGLLICIPAGSPITTLKFYLTPRSGLQPDPNTPANMTQPAPNYYQLLNQAGAPVTATVSGTPADGLSAGNCYDLTPVLSTVGLNAGAGLKIIANAVGQVELAMKS